MSDARPSAPVSNVRCADPFGAVRLADRPSWRTAHPHSTAIARASPHDDSTSAPTPSERTYPSAAASSVLHRPPADSIPACEAISVPCGDSFRLTAAATAHRHSLEHTACVAHCTATSADEHAVSTLEHGPCRPSTYDSRPLATDTLSPIAAYTEPRTDGGCTSAQSGRSMPTHTPPSLPSSDARRSAAPCSASYPSSSTSRCCGSIALASASDSPNALLSSSSAPSTKPPCGTLGASDVLQRAAGTRPIASPHAACSCSYARSLLLLPGHRLADPTTDTAVVAFEPAGVRASAADGTAARPCT